MEDHLLHGTAQHGTQSHFATFLRTSRFENARPKFGSLCPITWAPKVLIFRRFYDYIAPKEQINFRTKGAMEKENRL